MTKAKASNPDPATFLGTQEGKHLVTSIGSVSAGLRGIAGFLRKVLDGSTGLALPEKTRRKMTVKTPKAQRDPNLPRRPPSSFLMFMDDMRKRAAADGGPKISKLEMGALWRDLDKPSRDAYEKRYTEAYKAFEDERTAWESEHKPMSNPKKRKTEDVHMEDAPEHSPNVTPVAAAIEEVKPVAKKPKTAATAKPKPDVPAVTVPVVAPVEKVVEASKPKKNVSVVSPKSKKPKGSDSESVTSPTAVVAAQVLTSGIVDHAKAGSKKAKANGTKTSKSGSDTEQHFAAPAPAAKRTAEATGEAGKKKKKQGKNASE